MREYLTDDSFANTIRLIRVASAQKSFLIMEGDTDARVLKRFVGSECHIQVCNGRSSVINTVFILDAAKVCGCLGIVDKDFSDLLGLDVGSDNILLTDLNDLELLIFNSDAFDRFIAEYGNEDKIDIFQKEKQLLIRDILVRSASALGTLRYLSLRNGWGLDFEGMTIRFSERRDVEIDLVQQIEHLRGRSKNRSLPDTKIVQQEIDRAVHKFPNTLTRVCGHDLCEIISKGIFDVFGRAHVKLGKGGNAVEEVLRTAFTQENFSKTQLFAKIKAWESRYFPFRVLR